MTLAKSDYWYKIWFKRVRQSDIIKRSNAMKSNQKTKICSYHCTSSWIHYSQVSHWNWVSLSSVAKWAPLSTMASKIHSTLKILWLSKTLLSKSKVESGIYFRNSFKKQSMFSYCSDIIHKLLWTIINEFQDYDEWQFSYMSK